ncbi:MAG: DUF4011 domain-containing protein [Clostridia bacterium]|nr:DUF4011 domain-containing protein [Clostridia bacterium]
MAKQVKKGKAAKTVQQTIEIDGELLNCVNYAVYYCRIPLFTSFKIFNRAAEAAQNLVVKITGSTGLIMPQEINIEEIPAESSVEVAPQNILNPKYLADRDEPEMCTVSVQVVMGKAEVCNLTAGVQVLPMDYWGGTQDNAELLACFVRPRMADCQKVLTEAGATLSSWGYPKEFTGYAGNDKTAVRSAVASIYAAIRKQNVERQPQQDTSVPFSAGGIASVLEKKKATPVEMALFAASCLEAAKLNPVVLIGKDKAAVGVWLYGSCFSSSTEDDMSLIEKYIAQGVNNLAIFDADDIFAFKKAAYSLSETHFADKLKAKGYDMLLDIKRCRIGGFLPLPLKIKTAAGYELLKDTDSSYDEKPQEIIDASRFEYDKTVTRDTNWARRLLDLTQKNNLLNFRYRKDAIHVRCADLDSFFAHMDEKGRFTLLPTDGLVQDTYFDTAKALKKSAELIDIELNDGKMRTFQTAAEIQDAVSSLMRKNKAAEEEAGCSTLYLASGFLSWKYDSDKEFKYAPLALTQVTITRQKAQGTQVFVGSGCEVNTTLLEFLKQEFGVDVRGVEGKGLTPREIAAVFRSKTVDMKGWMVYEDVYIAQFTFARYAMWADVKFNMDEFSKNELIASLIANSNNLTNNKLSSVSEDESDPCDVITPLPSDSTQYSAVAESEKGTTFVLHGPPGTGKSQTITNMIANALYHGKRVLFVAEKQAALQVVKKRLQDIGIGDFCLELHSGKSADKGEIVKNIENTLLLTPQPADEHFASKGEEIVRVRDSLKAPLEALHKKRGLGVSVYEGIILYMQNKNAPELVNIESTFYDSLTAKKLADYETMLMDAQAAAKECGGIYRSPFSDVNITECNASVKTAVTCAAEVLLAELKHVKNYTGLFLDTFNQKVSTFTYKKLDAMVEIARILRDGELSTFYTCDEEAFYKFFNGSLKYDMESEKWLKNFRDLPNLANDPDDIEKEIDNWGENHRASKMLKRNLDRLPKLIAGGYLKEDEEVEWLRHACELVKARTRILTNTNLSRNFTGIMGGINDKKRADFMRPLLRFHDLCGQVFMDYNADSFNSVCLETSDGTIKPLLDGFISAAASFKKSADAYMDIINADKKQTLDEDIFEYYSRKCTSLLENIDMLPAWCGYRTAAKKMNDSGLTFMTDAMESGRVSGDQILGSFRKNVYRNFIRANIISDDVLSQFSANVLDENAATFSRLLDEFTTLTKNAVRSTLIANLPNENTDGPLALDLMSFRRRTKNLKTFNLRSLFTECGELMKVVAPCMLMSPITVSQYLPADSSLFDIVIFDEASQIPTCEAVPSLARAKSAVIVGDPNQMPPTSFFMSGGQDDEHPEAEDLDSVLDDCLALGIPQKYLIWHYRSKHESLIAFSNIMYYSSKLCTFPSPDALDSKVKLRYIENGTYDRGMSKCNKKEAEALVEEVIRRLKDDRLKRSSIGIVTFSTPQQIYIDRMLSKRIASEGLEEAAYEREEPLFVKNLENVQGDERDVIIFSVCYGPDINGRVSLNFGPLNQYGGWRRLNVAVSRAREEMVVFSSMRYSHIDLSRTASRGVAGLKAFLEFAEKGRTSISVKSDQMIINRQGIGKYIAEELSAYGYDCRCDVGVSDFKIDVAVVDPDNKHNFILAVLCDGSRQFSVKDRSVMQVQTLKRNNWNVMRLYTINFYNNPKREIKKIKDFLDKLTGRGKDVSSSGFAKPYKTAKLETKSVDQNYILSSDNDADIIKTIKAIVTAEEPISTQFLIKRILSVYGIPRLNLKLEAKLKSLISGCGFSAVDMCGNTYYYKTAKIFQFDRYRGDDSGLRSLDTDYTPFDVISAVRGILLCKVSMYMDELVPVVLKELKAPRQTDKLVSFVQTCIDEGVKRGLFIRSISDRISLS